MRGAFTAREDDGVQAGEIFWFADVGVFDADALEHFGVGFVIALDGQDADFHFLVSVRCCGKSNATQINTD